MKRYDVTVRYIDKEGTWESWIVEVSARDEVHALSKVLRRQGTVERLLVADRARFKVQPV